MLTTNELLIVIDMQRDFIDGSLANKEAQAIVPAVVERIRRHHGPIYYTMDTHASDYLETQEGHYLPVEHCIKGTVGWELNPEIAKALTMQGAKAFEKNTFGATMLAHALARANMEKPFTSITIVGVCTDICVISNAMLVKASLPNVPIYINADLCAGVTPESHQTALDAMAACQMAIIHG